MTALPRSPSAQALGHLILAVMLLLAVAPARGQFAPPSPPALAEQAGVTADDVTVEWAWSRESVEPGGRVVLAVVLEVPPPLHINVDPPRVPRLKYAQLIPTDVVVKSGGGDEGSEGGGGDGGSGGVRIGRPQYPEPHVIPVEIPGAPPTLPVYEGRVLVLVPVVLEEGIEPGEHEVRVAVTFQACNATTCFRAQTREMIATLRVEAMVGAMVGATVGGGGEAALTGDFEGFDDAGWTFDEAAIAAERAAVEREREGGGAVAEADPLVHFDLFGLDFTLDGGSAVGLGLTLALSVIGGLLLNFTPCVLPMIPIKIMGLAEAAGSPERCLRLGLAMGLGVLTFWLGLGRGAGGGVVDRIHQRAVWLLVVPPGCGHRDRGDGGGDVRAVQRRAARVGVPRPAKA